MELKKFIIIILLIAIPLLLLVLCYRNYAYNYCKNDMKCLEEKLTFNLGNLNDRLKSLKNIINEESNKNYNEVNEPNEKEEQIEGFFGGFGSWFSGSAPTNLPIAPGSLPNEDLMTLEKKINDKSNILKSSSFPPSENDVNGNSDDFSDSDNAELLDQVKKVQGKPYGSIKVNQEPLIKLSNNENPDLSEKSIIKNIVKSESVPSIGKSSEDKPMSVPVSKAVSLKALLGKCQFFDGKCPDNYVELGNFGLHGVSSNSILTCGNVQNTKPAKAIAHIKNNSVYEIHVLDQGHGFNPDSPPRINIDGGNGHGATADAIVDESGFLKSIKIINPGYNYTETPNILIDAPMMNSSCHLCCEDI